MTSITVLGLCFFREVIRRAVNETKIKEKTDFKIISLKLNAK